MRYRTEAQLINPTKKQWAKYKSLDRQIEEIVNKHGLTVIRTEYDNDLFIKSIVFNTNNVDEIGIYLFAFEVGNFLGRNKLKINVISRIEILPTVEKIRYVIKLVDSTQRNWDKFINSESDIMKFAEEENVVRENVVYNHEDYSLSVEVGFPDNKSRENVNCKVNSYMNKKGLYLNIVEAIQFKDYSDEITDLPLYSVNKLIDEAEQSLEKLSNM